MKWGDANHAKREILDAFALCSAHMEAFTEERLGKRSWKNSVVARSDRVVSGGFPPPGGWSSLADGSSDILYVLATECLGLVSFASMHSGRDAAVVAQSQFLQLRRAVLRVNNRHMDRRKQAPQCAIAAEFEQRPVEAPAAQ
jgi:hypothetical protein